MCPSITAIKYLFKYVYKGYDRTTAVRQDESEIKQNINARYFLCRMDAGDSSDSKCMTTRHPSSAYRFTYRTNSTLCLTRTETWRMQ